jgi:rRNA maturation endonuclease Nob1
MRLSGWPLTVIAAGVSIIISLVLLQFGIFFFFLPIVFVPFVQLLKSNKKTCHSCGLRSNGNFCPRCGSKLYKE